MGLQWKGTSRCSVRDSHGDCRGGGPDTDIDVTVNPSFLPCDKRGRLGGDSGLMNGGGGGGGG